MKKQFVTYEIALKLKELGFDKECFGEYNDSKQLLIYYPNECFNGYCEIKDYLGAVAEYQDILAPLWQQAQSFLDANEVIIGIIFVDNVFKYTLNTDNYVSNGFEDRMSAVKSATENATNYLWNKKFNK